MSALTDLNASLTELTATVATATTTIEAAALAVAAAASDDAGVETVVTSLNALNKQMQTNVATLAAALPQTPPPLPAA